MSSFFDKVTTGTHNLQSNTLNVAPVGELSLCSGLAPSISRFSKLVITQFLSYVKLSDTSQLINDISKPLQKLPKYFNGTAISALFEPSSAAT